MVFIDPDTAIFTYYKDADPLWSREIIKVNITNNFNVLGQVKVLDVNELITKKIGGKIYVFST